jgi:hypothetical protein
MKDTDNRKGEEHFFDNSICIFPGFFLLCKKKSWEKTKKEGKKCKESQKKVSKVKN